MDNIDATDRSVPISNAPPPSLLILVLDTNPLSWAKLSSSLPLHSVLSTLLIFINAHLTLNHANRVAVLASHTDRAVWLYPTPEGHEHDDGRHEQNGNGDNNAARQVNGHDDVGSSSSSSHSNDSKAANKYRPFATVEEQVMANIKKLMASTPIESLSADTPPRLAGALLTALSYANMQTMLSLPVPDDSNGTAGHGIPGGNDFTDRSSGAAVAAAAAGNPEAVSEALVTRILVLSVSPADLSNQYIFLMNSVFAAQRMRIPIDVLRIGDRTAFLQQASDTTNGVFLTYALPAGKEGGSRSNGSSNGDASIQQQQQQQQQSSSSAAMVAAGLLQTLMMAYLPDVTARRSLVVPGDGEVDFRPACFCHQKVVDLGGVCSVCLSIFCMPLPDTDCPTCGTQLRLPKGYGVKPAVAVRKKKKKKKLGESGRDSPAVGTPTSVPG